MSALWPTLGLGLLALIVLYFRLLRARPEAKAWQAILMLIGLLLLIPTNLFRAETATDLPLVVVVDASYSMGPRLGDACDWSTLNAGPNRPLLVIAAGSRPLEVFTSETASLPTTWPRPREFDDSAFRAWADLGAAIAYAREKLDDQAFELIVVTDGGLRNLGPTAAQILAAQVVAGPLRRADDLGLRLIGAPPQLDHRAPSTVRLGLYGYLNSDRELRVEVSGQTSIDCNLKAGPIDEVLVLAVQAPDPEAGQLRARLLPSGADADPANDLCIVPFSWAERAALKLKLYEGPTDSAVLTEWLSSFDGIDVLPSSAALATADLVLIDNCRLADLSFSETELRAQVLAGQGLLLTGAEESFGAGGWENSVLDELSPLKARPGKKPRLLRFALDRSGSMSRDQRLLAARASLRAVFKHLAPDDRLELTLFAGDQKTTTYARNDPTAAERLDQDLARVTAGGGTDLRGLLDQISRRPAGTETDDVLIILATDGRDPRGLDLAFCAQISERLQAQGMSLQVFWFDRDETLRPALETLASTPDRLQEVDDFSRMLEPYFRAQADELRLEDVELARRDGEGIELPRLLRTRRDAAAEVLAWGTEDVNGLARIDRGLGRVAAAPIDLVAAVAAGLFDQPEAQGEPAFRDFLLGLAPTTSPARVERQLGAGTERLLVELDQADLAGSHLLIAEGQRLGLASIAPGRARSAARPIVPAAQALQLVNAQDQSLGLVLLAAVPAVDQQPASSERRLENWLQQNLKEPLPGSGRAQSLVILVLVLLAIDLILRSRGR